jgi:hypothetical protein
MFITSTITRIAATAVAALVVGGSGTAALVGCIPGSASAGADLSAKADADLSLAVEAHEQAAAALATGSAEGQATAEALLEASTTQLEKASVELRAAVDAGSKTAVNGIADFTRKSVALVNGIAATATVTADASVQAGTRLATAVDTQVQAAKSVVSAQGAAALKALSEIKVTTPPPPPVSASVSGNVSSNTSVSAPPADLVSSTTGQLGISLGK